MNRTLKTIAAWGILSSACLALSGTLHAHDHKDAPQEKHSHDYKKGPNGGQLIASVKPAFEITVDKERKVRLLFVSEENKPLPISEQVITGVTGNRSNPVRLTFAKGKDQDENVLISNLPLPAGDHIGLILQIRQNAEAKPVTERLTLHLH